MLPPGSLRLALVSLSAFIAIPALAAPQDTQPAGSAPNTSAQNDARPTDAPGARGAPGPNPIVTGGETPSPVAPGPSLPITRPQPPAGSAGGSAARPAPSIPPAPVSSPPPNAAGTPQEPVTQDDLQGIRTDLENFKFQWQHERDIHTAITTRALTINSVIQARFGYIDQEPLPTATSYGRKTTFDVPTAILVFNGSLYRDYEDGRNLTYSLRLGTSQQQSNNSSFPNLLDATVTYSPLPTVAAEYPQLTISLGQQLLPFGLEVPATEELKPVIRNADFTTRLGLARREVGLIVRGDLLPQVDYGYSYRQGTIAYALGIVNGNGPNTLDDNNNKDIVGRIALTVPCDYNSWLRQITVGGTVYIGKQNTFLTDPAKTLAGKGIRNRYGVDIYYNHWPFGLTGEYIRGVDVATPGKTLADPKRTELQSVSYTGTLFLSFGAQFVAGFRNQGRYDDWWPKTYQPFVRVDYFDPNRDTSDDQVETITGGLNVFFAETTKLQINYNHRNDHATQRGASNELLGQVQFGF